MLNCEIATLYQRLFSLFALNVKITVKTIGEISLFARKAKNLSNKFMFYMNGIPHIRTGEVSEFLTPKVVSEFLNPYVVSKFLTPKVVSEFLTPKVVSEFLTPNVVSEFLTPKVVSEFLTPKVVSRENLSQLKKIVTWPGILKEEQ